MNERLKNILGGGSVILLIVGIIGCLVMAVLFPPPPERYVTVCLESRTVTSLSYATGGAGSQSMDGGIVMAPIGGGQAITTHEECTKSERRINPAWTQWKREHPELK